MIKEYDQVQEVLIKLMVDYENGSILENEDSMVTWKAQMEWLIKRLIDVKVGAVYQYALKNKVLK